MGYAAECDGTSIHVVRRWPPSRILGVFLAVWFAAGLAQSYFTNLSGEEAYYALFGKHLAWGYFDHPPGIAFFTRIGMIIFSGDLGPRFMMVVLSTATIWIGSRLIEPRKIPLYLAVISGLALTQAGSFVIKTDVPLLFFVTVFFYFYREYLAGRQRIAICVLPVAIAGMLLSKYHGILVVVFTLLSNPGLLRRPSFWLIAILSLVLMIPHAIWLQSHDWVTVRYHLGGRTDAGFSWKNVIQFVLIQPFVFGPAVGLLLLPAAIIKPASDAFERALKFNAIGILAFFFVASFSVHIHMHWTSIALVPILTLAIPFLYDRVKLRKLLLIAALATAGLFVPVRIYVAWDYLPAFLDRRLENTHGWAQWAQELRKLADGRCVVFLDDCNSAGKYTWYTGEMAHSFNSCWSRNSQQDLWPIEESFRGYPAFIISDMPRRLFKSAILSDGSQFWYRLTDDFQGYSKIGIELADDGGLRCKAAVPFDLRVVLVSHYAEPIFFKPHTELSPVLSYYFVQGERIASQGRCDVLAGMTLQHELGRLIELRPPAIPGKYILRLAISSGWLPPPNNSRAYVVAVDP